jgi:hypothetical protein
MNGTSISFGLLIVLITILLLHRMRKHSKIGGTFQVPEEAARQAAYFLQSTRATGIGFRTLSNTWK